MYPIEVEKNFFVVFYLNFEGFSTSYLEYFRSLPYLPNTTLILNPCKIAIYVGTPPSNDAWRTSPNDTWHAFLSGLPHLDFPTMTRGTLLLSGLSSGRGTRHSRTLHPDDRHIASGWPTYPIRICLSGSLTKISKSCTSFQQPATTHVPPLVEWKDRNEVTASRFPRSLSAARRVMMTLPLPRGIMTKLKYLPIIKEGDKVSNTIYIDLHTKRKVSLLYLVKDQLIYLSELWLTKPSEGVSGRLLQGRLNQKFILVEIVRPSIWQLRRSLGTRCLNNIAMD